ncbi:MAG: sensor histidine kinase [Aureispira sp.]|nr:sensor histidine kinase [Aureispira sp.]
MTNENTLNITELSINERLYQFLSRRVVYHTLIWMVYLGFNLVNSYRSTEGFLFNLTNVIIHTTFLGGLVYINLLFLIPKYLLTKRFFSYIGLLFFATIVTTPLELISLYWNLSPYPKAQELLLNNQLAYFIFLFFAVCTSTILKIIKEWIVQQQIQRDLERRNLQSELSFLKSQINPHFLFNTLNSIYALSLKRSENAPNIVLRLSEMMRYMLYECNEKKVPLSREIQYIQNYLELERVRYGNKARIEFDFMIENPGQYQIAPLLFIPFLENSFKHGLSHHIDGTGFVEILLQVDENVLDFTIQNSKTDLKAERYFQGGIGLKNVNRRLELLYPNRYELEATDTDEAYIVNLTLELEQIAVNSPQIAQ